MEVKKLSSPAIGKAGELRVRSELILQGFNPAICDFDDGTDIILSNGKKIGVKTASRPERSKQNYAYAYRFSLMVPRVRQGDGHSNYRKVKKVYLARDWSNYVDYWALWCIQDNIFYIIPRNAMTSSKIAIYMPAPIEERIYKKHTMKQSISKYEKYKNNWEQLKE